MCQAEAVKQYEWQNNLSFHSFAIVTSPLFLQSRFLRGCIHTQKSSSLYFPQNLAVIN